MISRKRTNTNFYTLYLNLGMDAFEFLLKRVVQGTVWCFPPVGLIDHTIRALKNSNRAPKSMVLMVVPSYRSGEVYQSVQGSKMVKLCKKGNKTMLNIKTSFGYNIIKC